MKTASLARWMILVSLGVFLLVADAQEQRFARPPENGRQAWLLDLLKTLADSGGLADPDKVGAVLGVHFDKAVVTTSPSHMEQFAKSFERDEYTPTTNAWFVAGPPGYASTLRMHLASPWSSTRICMRNAWA